MNHQIKTNNPVIQNAFKKLQEGNQRFRSGVVSIENLPTVHKLKALAENGQKPFAIVLCCADSRAPTELIFDQGIGDLFVLRIAGNVVGPKLIASMEFAATQFGSALIVVMGHTRCGAVKATIDLTKSNQRAPSANLEDLVQKIRPSVTQLKFTPKSDTEHLQHATWANVNNSMKAIVEQSQILSDLVDSDKLAIVGSVFDLDTGEIVYEHNQVNSNLKAV